MGTDFKYSQRYAQCKSTNTIWTFQNIFNALFVVFFLLSSVSIWVCLIEINKLKQSTMSLVETISFLKDDKLLDTHHIKVGAREHGWEEISKRNLKPDFETMKREVKHVSKRATVPVGKAYDPLSPAPQTVSKHYSWF